MPLDWIHLWSHDFGENDLLHHLHRTGVGLRETTLNAVDPRARAGKRNCAKLLLTLSALHDDTSFSLSEKHLFYRRKASDRAQHRRLVSMPEGTSGVGKLGHETRTPSYTALVRLSEGDIAFGSREKVFRSFYTMKTIRYRTSVAEGLSYDPKTFRDEIHIYLADPDGWAQFYKFVESPPGPNVKHIRLTNPTTLKTNGCESDALSCAVLGGTEIWLNADRWIHGAPKSRLPLVEYRQYMVSHEMGHSLGYEHVACPGSGPAPIMLQQTLGIGRCTPNTKLTKYDRTKK